MRQSAFWVRKIDEAKIWILFLFQWPRESSTRFGFLMGSSNREPVPARGFGSLVQIPDKIQNSLKVDFFSSEVRIFFFLEEFELAGKV